MLKFLYLLIALQTTLSATSYTSEELGKKLFAVHATNTLPESNFLIAGHQDTPKDWPCFRPTIHFSLGELVRPLDDWISWEDNKYAIVTPLDNLYPQLINLNCYDTFILGNLQLDRQTILVAPEGTTVASPSFSLFEYGADSTLREAVDQVISLLDGWKVTMSGEDLEDTYPPAMVGETNINTHEIFNPILDSLPHLSLGLRFYPYHGEAWRFAQTEMLLITLAQILEEDRDCENFQKYNFPDLYNQLTDHYQTLVKTYLEEPSLNDLSKNVLAEKLEIITKWMNRLEEEVLHLQVA